MSDFKAPESSSTSIQLIAIPGIPDIKKGNSLGAVLLECLMKAGIELVDGDIVAIAHKIVSKAEGRLVNLNHVTVSEYALEIAEITKKDPRLVELILLESDEISRMREGVLIVRHRLGFTSANAGIDRSNVPQNCQTTDNSGLNSNLGDWVLLLPLDPDASAARIAGSLKSETGAEIGVIIVDSHGRPFRLGTVGVAIGVYGIPALWDRRGDTDLYGYVLQHTEVGTADELAAAASLLMGQADEGQPAILIRGLWLPKESGKASDLIRPEHLDLYRDAG
jgi:coenzyme F420-0:L-glutamate ligase/coenzyme F420-1:gamma-L-glutamate ligase